MNVFLYVLYAFLDDWTDFDEIFCVCLSGSLDDLDSLWDLCYGSKFNPGRCSNRDFKIYDGHFCL